MDVLLQAAVVIAAVIIEVRFGSIGLGICGGGGLMILNQVFGLKPTAAPVDVILIILTVVTAAATMRQRVVLIVWFELQKGSFVPILKESYLLLR